MKILLLILIMFFSSLNVYASGVNKLLICQKDVINDDFIELDKDCLVKGKVKVNPVVPSAVSYKISLDAGSSFEDIQNNEFEFVPQEAQEYPVLIKAKDAAGKDILTKVIVIRYFSVDIKKEFEDIFDQMRQFYVDERSSELLKFFGTGYPNFSAFEQSLRDTFDQNSNLNLFVVIKNITLKDDGKFAVLRVDWDKRFEYDFTQSGRNNEVHFKKENGKWKIVYLKDDTIFIVGTGTLTVGSK